MPSGVLHLFEYLEKNSKKIVFSFGCSDLDYVPKFIY